jgi:caa(3)-type oxidase subunit IV
MSDPNERPSRTSRIWLRPIAVWGLLVLLALASIDAAYRPFHELTTPLCLAIAVAMVILTWLYLMDLIGSDTLVRLIAAAGLLWLSFMFALTFSDYLFRPCETSGGGRTPFCIVRPAHEYRVQRRDGEVRWVEVRWQTHFEGDRRELGTESVVGTVQDITERKECEQRERFLIREVNHRTRNMLSVVNAIAHQTSIGRPEDFPERLSERIQALSAYQDLLVRNEWRGVEIGDLVRAQLAHFADLIGSRIVMQGPRLRLNAASAQAIGLALHELGTNAGKYGALCTDAGRVDIRWGVDGDTFAISWNECGGPRVSTPEQRGFGTIVMETMAERSVDGSVELNHASSGLIWRLTCPRANGAIADFW